METQTTQDGHTHNVTGRHGRDKGESPASYVMKAYEWERLKPSTSHEPHTGTCCGPHAVL